jgi:plasmid stabilization system protein ParE
MCRRSSSEWREKPDAAAMSYWTMPRLVFLDELAFTRQTTWRGGLRSSPVAARVEVEADLDAIWEYIADDGQDAAGRVVDQIELAIAAIVPFPHQGDRRPDFTARPLRFTNAGIYPIAYAPDKTRLWVVALMHGTAQPAHHGNSHSRGPRD